MSSIKFDTSISGEEVRKMTTQWGYTSLPGQQQSEATRRKTTRRKSKTLKKTARVANKFMHHLLVLAGGATGLAILAGVATILKSWIS